MALLKSLSERHSDFQSYQIVSYYARIPTESSGTIQGLRH